MKMSPAYEVLISPEDIQVKVKAIMNLNSVSIYHIQ